MTKRTNKPKAAPTVAPTINSTAPTSPLEGVKAETKAKVASKPKQANSTVKKAPSKPRSRSKKAVVEKPAPPEGRVGQEHQMPAPVSKVVDVDSRTITYASAGNAVPSKYEQFKAWLVFKLYVVTSYFRGY